MSLLHKCFKKELFLLFLIFHKSYLETYCRPKSVKLLEENMDKYLCEDYLLDLAAAAAKSLSCVRLCATP